VSFLVIKEFNNLEKLRYGEQTENNFLDQSESSQSCFDRRTHTGRWYDLEYVGDKYSPGEMHYRFVQGEFDVAEMSTATLMRAKEKGKRFLALPVFFQRGPRQRNIFPVPAG